MKRNHIVVFLLILLALGSVWLFFYVTSGCNASLTQESDMDSPKSMDVVVSTISEGDVNKCIGSFILSTFQRILYEEKSSEIDSCVVLFHAEVFLSDDVLQNELQALLKKLHPYEMSAALKSSGNVHNPKLSFLYAALRPAIRDTPSMQELSRISRSYGYDTTIQILGGEKLQFRRKDLNGKRFVDPNKRIYGVFGFSARKSGWENKTNLKARIVDIDAKGSVLADDIKMIDKGQYW